jgi:zinc transport system substrate-binding protein
MTKWTYFISILLLISCDSGKNRTAGDTGEKPTVAVVNYPLYYFVSEIGEDQVQVYFPSISGDPAYWKPDARQILNFQKADLIIANGAGFEKWMGKVSLPSSKVVNTSMDFKDLWIEVEEGVAHSHGPEGEHVHKGIAFTTWVNFNFAILQATAVKDALCDLLPDHKQSFTNNFKRLISSLKILDERMQLVGSELNGAVIIASHPVYQYLEQGYGLNIQSLHLEPREVPDEATWTELKKLTEKKGAKIMLWEGEPLESTREKLHQLGLEVVVFDPCANRPGAGDFLSVMQESVSRLEHCVGL